MHDSLERRLREQALLSARVEGDRLVLGDAVLRAAIDGARALSMQEKAALLASPLTLRRFRALALAARRRPPAANEPCWHGSAGLLRAAATAMALQSLQTDDGHWSLDFLPGDGGWRIVLRLDPGAPFAASLLASGVALRVCDGAGATVLRGQLDTDGECESAWPFGDDPARHFLDAGGAFTVAPERG